MMSGEKVSLLIQILQDIKKTYEYNQALIEDKEKETQDLLHEIELGSFDAKRGGRLAKELKNVRRERRRAMDENLTLKILYEYFEGKPLLKDLQRMQGEIAREAGRLGSRVYTPRIRKDLTIPCRQKETAVQKAFRLAGKESMQR